MSTKTRIRQATATQRLLTISQATQETGIPQRSIYDLMYGGLLKYVQFGGRRRIWIDRLDLSKLIEEHKLQH